jgi:hypothetical protein
MLFGMSYSSEVIIYFLKPEMSLWFKFKKVCRKHQMNQLLKILLFLQGAAGYFSKEKEYVDTFYKLKRRKPKPGAW